MKIFESIVDTIGNTPLIRFKKLGRDLGADIVLKLEFFNPLGSVKDRIGANMIKQAIAAGDLKPGMEVIEPTSGNTGIALAFICAALGYPITLVMPETMSQERRTLLLLLGAKIILTPGPLGMKGAIAKALEIHSTQTNLYMPRQFENPANPSIHESTTALEIWNDTDGKVDIFLAGVGTGGTISGVGKVLKSKKSEVKVIAVEPSESAVISGEKAGPHKIQGIGAGFVPKNLKVSLIDQVEKVSSEVALKTAREVILTEGIPVGISGGAAIAAALKVAAEPKNKGKMIVVILASYTERYLSSMLAETAREEAKNLPVATVLDSFLAKVGTEEGHVL